MAKTKKELLKAIRQLKAEFSNVAPQLQGGDERLAAFKGEWLEAVNELEHAVEGISDKQLDDKKFDKILKRLPKVSLGEFQEIVNSKDKVFNQKMGSIKRGINTGLISTIIMPIMKVASRRLLRIQYSIKSFALPEDKQYYKKMHEELTVKFDRKIQKWQEGLAKPGIKQKFEVFLEKNGYSINPDEGNYFGKDDLVHNANFANFLEDELGVSAGIPFDRWTNALKEHLSSAQAFDQNGSLSGFDQANNMDKIRRVQEQSLENLESWRKQISEVTEASTHLLENVDPACMDSEEISASIRQRTGRPPKTKMDIGDALAYVHMRIANIAKPGGVRNFVKDPDATAKQIQENGEAFKETKNKILDDHSSPAKLLLNDLDGIEKEFYDQFRKAAKQSPDKQKQIEGMFNLATKELMLIRDKIERTDLPKLRDPGIYGKISQRVQGLSQAISSDQIIAAVQSPEVIKKFNEDIKKKTESVKTEITSTRTMKQKWANRRKTKESRESLVRAKRKEVLLKQVSIFKGVFADQISNELVGDAVQIDQASEVWTRRYSELGEHITQIDPEELNEEAFNKLAFSIYPRVSVEELQEKLNNGELENYVDEAFNDMMPGEERPVEAVKIAPELDERQREMRELGMLDDLLDNNQMGLEKYERVVDEAANRVDQAGRAPTIQVIGRPSIIKAVHSPIDPKIRKKKQERGREE